MKSERARRRNCLRRCVVSYPIFIFRSASIARIQELGTYPSDFNMEAGRSQIAAILSEFSPYVVPDDPSAIREVLVSIATYAHQLERDLAKARQSLPQKPQCSETSRSPPELDDSASRTPVPPGPPTGTIIKDGANSGEDALYVEMTDYLRRLTIDPSSNRFFGRSSNVILVKTAMDIKKESTGEEVLLSRNHPVRRPKYWDVASVSSERLCVLLLTILTLDSGRVHPKKHSSHMNSRRTTSYGS